MMRQTDAARLEKERLARKEATRRAKVRACISRSSIESRPPLGPLSLSFFFFSFFTRHLSYCVPDPRLVPPLSAEANTNTHARARAGGIAPISRRAGRQIHGADCHSYAPSPSNCLCRVLPEPRSAASEYPPPISSPLDHHKATRACVVMDL